MPADFLKMFTSLGLAESEAKIYLASLSLGPTSVQEIARKAGISRTASYDAIENLKERGLMSTYDRDKKKYFAAEEPEGLVAHFKDSVNIMVSQIDSLKEKLPELKMQAGGEKPKVRFYEGKDALYALFQDVQKVSPEFMYEVTNINDVYTMLDSKILDDARKVVDPNKTKMKILHRGQTRKVRSSKTEFCELAPELGDFHGDIWIYENRVAFVTFVGKIMCVIIENEAFAQTAQVLFKAAWDISQARTENRK